MSSSININNIFFQGEYKHVWRKEIPQGLSEAEADFIQEIGSLNKNTKVLDFMCGYGRHALELAKRGISIKAVDNLFEYISEISTIATAEGLPITAVQQDVLTMDLRDEVYDAAICMGNSLAFFNKEDATSILKNIATHLKEEGILIINSGVIAEIAIREFRERDWHYIDQYKCIFERSYHFYPPRIEFEETIISPNGSIEKVKGVDYVFSLNELDEMFQKAGLKTKSLYSTPRKRKYTFGDIRIYIVAEKLNERD